jgi:hypothetical protein
VAATPRSRGRSRVTLQAKAADTFSILLVKISQWFMATVSSPKSGMHTRKAGDPPFDSTHAALSLGWSRSAIRKYPQNTSGFGSIMMANFTIKNPTQYSFKDVEIECTHTAPSGTKIDSNTRTIYEVVAPKSTKVIRNMNMGFIRDQVSSSSCGITDLVVM